MFRLFSVLLLHLPAAVRGERHAEQSCDDHASLQVSSGEGATASKKNSQNTSRVSRSGNSIQDEYKPDEQYGRPLSHEYCRRALEDKNHVFHAMWAWEGYDDNGFLFSSGPQQRKCWDFTSQHQDDSVGAKETYFRAVYDQNVSGLTCDRNWVTPYDKPIFTANTSAMLGMDVDLEWEEFHVYMPNVHRLKLMARSGLERWNMCRNFEFIFCAAMGALENQAGGSIIMATEAGSIMPDWIVPVHQGAYWAGASNYRDSTLVFLLETCVLDAICSNREELYSTHNGGTFECVFDSVGFYALSVLV